MEAEKPIISGKTGVSVCSASNSNIEEADIRKISGKMRAYSRFKIFTHKDPDGDAVGSMLALGKILFLQDKAAEMLVFDFLDDQFYFLPGFAKIKVQKEFFAEDDSLVIFVDCHSAERTGFPEEFFRNRESVALDHHLPSGRAEQNSARIVAPATSSTAEIIFSLADRIGWKIDRDASLCLLAGILADTGTFQHANTSPRSLCVVSRLVQNGANLKKIAGNLFRKKEVGGALKIWGEILGRAAVDERIGMAFSFVLKNDFEKYRVGEEELGGLVNLLAGIPESRFSLLLTENKSGKIKASLRSEPYKGTDVEKIARIFGGGGHRLAAGFEIYGTLGEKLEEIKEKIAKEIEV